MFTQGIEDGWIHRQLHLFLVIWSVATIGCSSAR
jgi:hypothetical protein